MIVTQGNKVIVNDNISHFDDNILNIYKFGSHCYGTNDEQSDFDYIIITKNFVESNNINHHYITFEIAQSLLDNMDIQMLECYFLPKEHIVKESIKFSFNIDLQKLRVSISTIASNSFVKGKKKLIVTGDYDLRAGIKSYFHSLRILYYGKQLAQQYIIYDYKGVNYILDDLKQLSQQYQRIELSQKIEEKYKPLYNKLSSEFKQLAPKDLSEKNKKLTIEKLLQKYNIHNEELTCELIGIL